MFGNRSDLSLKYCLQLDKVDRDYHTTIVAATGAAGNWTAGSAWVGGVAPTAADDAQITTLTTSITIDSGAVCRSADFTGCTGTITHSSGVTWTIGDATAGLSSIALKLVSGITYTLGSATTSAISFVSTSATVQTVDFASKTTGNITFNATSNGSWQYTGGHTVGTATTVNLTKGTLDINGQTCSWGIFDSNNANTRSITLGTANVTLTGSNTTTWTTNNTTGLTQSTASSTLIFTGSSVTFACRNTYGTVTMSGAGTYTLGLNLTCTTFTRTGTAAKTDTLTLNGSLTTSGTLTFNSNSSINRLVVQSNTVGTARTITAAAVVITNIVDFQDITGAGAATWTVAGTGATAIGDCGGNTGITASTPVTQTWSGTSGGNWSANAWTSRVPLPQDDVAISSAFSASQTVTADMPRLGASINWTSATGSPIWASSISMSMYGSLTFISGMTITWSGGCNFNGRGSFTITSAGKTIPTGVGFAGFGGTYTLQDALTLSGNTSSWNLTAGGFDANGFNVTFSQFVCNGTITRSLTMGSGTWTSYWISSGNLWTMTTSGLTFSGANASIILSGVTSNAKLFTGGSLTYGTLTYTVAGSTGELDITGSNTFSVINFSDVTNARSLKFTAGTTTTIVNTNGFNVQGTSGKLMTVTSITAATHTITSANGQVCDYLSLSQSIAPASPTFFAGKNSTDGGSNSNWVFTGPLGTSPSSSVSPSASLSPSSSSSSSQSPSSSASPSLSPSSSSSSSRSPSSSVSSSLSPSSSVSPSAGNTRTGESGSSIANMVNMQNIRKFAN